MGPLPVKGHRLWAETSLRRAGFETVYAISSPGGVAASTSSQIWWQDRRDSGRKAIGPSGPVPCREGTLVPARRGGAAGPTVEWGLSDSVPSAFGE